MIKLNILNLKNFWEALDQCQGVVRMLGEDGKQTILDQRQDLRAKLRRRYEEGGDCLPLTLAFSCPSDYMRMVSYYAGDC